MIKLIAIDLDGTLLNNGKEISQKNTQAIQEATKMGIEIVIATGRSTFDAKSLIGKIGFKPWIIGTNGATIHTPDGELFYSLPLQKNLAINTLSLLEEDLFYYEAFIEHKICTPDYGINQLYSELDERRDMEDDEVKLFEMEMKIQFEQIGRVTIKNYKDLLNTDSEIYNILAISFNEEKLIKGIKKFSDIPEIELVKSSVNNFHLQNENASKGNALKILANHLSIDLSETAAVGDNYNDLSMLEVVGRSAAMGNADNEIKSKCDEVTLRNDEDGVAHFINSIIIGKGESK